MYTILTSRYNNSLLSICLPTTHAQQANTTRKNDHATCTHCSLAKDSCLQQMFLSLSESNESPRQIAQHSYSMKKVHTQVRCYELRKRSYWSIYREKRRSYAVVYDRACSTWVKTPI